MSRYKKIKFENFGKGESQNLLSSLGDIYISNKVELTEKQKIKLSRETDFVLIANARNPEIIHDPANSRILITASLNVGGGNFEACLYSMANDDPAGGFTLEKNFGSGYIYGIELFKDIVIVSVYIGAGRLLKWADTSDLTTWTDCLGIDASDNAVMQ